MKNKKYKANYKAKKAYSSSKKYANKKLKNKPKKKKKLFSIFQNKKSTYKAAKHKSGMNYYVDKQGEYKIKPWFANFWKVGFLDDIPTGADYDREMDGIVYYDYVTDSYHTADEDSKRNLYGLERLQMSINRLWNGSPREWLKLIFRVLLIIFLITGWFGLFHYLFSWEHSNIDNQVHDFMNLFDIFGLIN